MKGNRNSNKRMCVIGNRGEGVVEAEGRELFQKQRGSILGTHKFMRLAHAHIVDLACVFVSVLCVCCVCVWTVDCGRGSELVLPVAG